MAERLVNVSQADDTIRPGYTAIISLDAVSVVFPTWRHYWQPRLAAQPLADGRAFVEADIDALCAGIKRSLLEQIRRKQDAEHVP